MKTLRKLEREKLREENTKVNNLMKSYNRNDISDVTKEEILKRIKLTKKAIGNLPDLVRQEIARNANLLFDGFRESISDPKLRNLYFTDFEDYIEALASLEEDVLGEYQRISKDAYNIDVQKAILYFGLTRKELDKIFDKGFDNIAREIFMAFINRRYKTEIPSMEELLQAKKALDEAEDTVEKIEAKYTYSQMLLNNGAYIQSEYPIYYKKDLDTRYKELIKEAKSEIKRRLK